MSKNPSYDLSKVIGECESKPESFFSSTKQKVIAVGTAGVVAVGDLSAAVIMPAADYTDIELAAAIGFGITITVGLLMKAKRFFG